MLNLKEIDLIERYLSGNANGEESEIVEQMFADGKYNSALHSYLRNSWNITLSKPAEEIDLTHLLYTVRQNVLKPQEHQKLSPYALYSKVAAILLLPVVLALFYLMFSWKDESHIVLDLPSKATIEAPMGARVSFVLPDGTKGFLNSGSSLSYQLPFTSNRNIELQGEANFEVIANAENPFIVQIAGSAIKVLGTQFNLNAYPDAPYIEVILVEGSLEFIALTGSQPVEMHPGERLIFREKQIFIENTDVLKYTSWTQGKLIFRGDPMSEVVRRISRWFNVEVVIVDSELDQYFFRGTFEDDSLEEVMRLIQMTSPIRYRILPRSQNGDGSWNREQVIISKRS